MNYISSFFTSTASPLSPLHQTYFDKLPVDVCEILMTFEKKDREKLLETFSKQSEERVQLIVNILSQQRSPVLDELFKKEVRLLNALLKVDTHYMEEYSKLPEYVEEVIMKKKNETL